MADNSIADQRAPADEPRVLLAGNPNSGKTTLFNVLTGHRYKVANYPGVTVERKEGKAELPDGSFARLIDLPGIYSLSGQSQDELVAEESLRSTAERPDLVVAVVDASNLERNLFLITEIIDLGLPLVVALNMSDLARVDGLDIKELILSRSLDVPVVPLVASKRQGVSDLLQAMSGVLQNGKRASSKRFDWASGDERLIELSRSEHLGFSDEAAGELASARYRWIEQVVQRSVVRRGGKSQRFSDQADRILLHPVIGLVIFAVAMAFIFQAVFTWASWPMDLIEAGMGEIAKWFQSILPAGELRSLIVDGILAGVGSVIVFVPQIAILFFLIGLLEDSGYLCRAAFIMDRVMRKVGLQGRSFIPLLSSFACAVPGIMATRTIPSRADRLVTILVAPLMSCSARLPVYAVLIGAFIPAISYGVLSLQGLVLFALYLLGIIAAAAVAWLLKVSLLRGEPALFLMEMPRFRVPTLGVVLHEVWDRVKIFIKNAGSVILACSMVLWFLAAHPRVKEGGSLRDTYAGKIGTAIEPIIKPLGYDWQLGVGLLASFAAREVFVSSLATIYNLEAGDDSAQSLKSALQERSEQGKGWGIATALSLLVFYVFACQCMSTLAVCRRETGSWSWTAFMFFYMTVLAYAAAFVTYRAVLLYSG